MTTGKILLAEYPDHELSWDYGSPTPPKPGQIPVSVEQ